MTAHELLAAYRAGEADPEDVAASVRDATAAAARAAIAIRSA